MQLHDQPICSPVLEQAINCHLLTVAPDTPLSEVIVSLKSGDWGNCALVMDGAQLVGLFTEDDIIQLNRAEMSLEKIKVADVMRGQVITINLSNLQNVFTLSSLLQQHQIHHLPVIGEGDEILGIVTPESICQALEKEISNINSAFSSWKFPKGKKWNSVT